MYSAPSATVGRTRDHLLMLEEQALRMSTWSRSLNKDWVNEQQHRMNVSSVYGIFRCCWLLLPERSFAADTCCHAFKQRPNTPQPPSRPFCGSPDVPFAASGVHPHHGHVGLHACSVSYRSVRVSFRLAGVLHTSKYLSFLSRFLCRGASLHAARRFHADHPSAMATVGLRCLVKRKRGPRRFSICTTCIALTFTPLRRVPTQPDRGASTPNVHTTRRVCRSFPTPLPPSVVLFSFTALSDLAFESSQKVLTAGKTPHMSRVDCCARL